jgi:hypothetical protein
MRRQIMAKKGVIIPLNVLKSWGEVIRSPFFWE